MLDVSSNMQAKNAYPLIFGNVKVKLEIILYEFGNFYPTLYRSYCGRKFNFSHLCKPVSAVTRNISVKSKKHTKW